MSIPTPTSPIPTTTTTATATAGGKKKHADDHHHQRLGQLHDPRRLPGLQVHGPRLLGGGRSGEAWDQNGKTCNTVDNPESPIGPQRTCSVEGFSCTAKRDIHSDARFVTCTQGGQSIRFTWLPA